MSIKTVKVPEAMEPLFEKAEKFVSEIFAIQKNHPEKGMILIGGKRYILVNAESMSVSFFEHFQKMYPTLDEELAQRSAATMLYDLAQTVGRTDARRFHRIMNVTDPVAKLSAGPVHFAFSGWAFVDIHSESNPVPDKSFYLVYDHPNSFEAEAWISRRKELMTTDKETELHTKTPVCYMNAGYSSGWCVESFGIELTSRELFCRATGDPYCRFIMAHPEKIDEFIIRYKKNHPQLFKKHG